MPCARQARPTAASRRCRRGRGASFPRRRPAWRSSRRLRGRHPNRKHTHELGKHLPPVRPIVHPGFDDDLVGHGEDVEIPIEKGRELGETALVLGAAPHVKEGCARRETRVVEEHGVEIILPKHVLHGVVAERALERGAEEEGHGLHRGPAHLLDIRRQPAGRAEKAGLRERPAQGSIPTHRDAGHEPRAARGRRAIARVHERHERFREERRIARNAARRVDEPGAHAARRDDEHLGQSPGAHLGIERIGEPFAEENFLVSAAVMEKVQDREAARGRGVIRRRCHDEDADRRRKRRRGDPFLAASGRRVRREGREDESEGGGRGIGRAISLSLARAGATVVLASRTANEVERTKEEIEAEGGKALAVATDVTSRASVQALAARAKEATGRIDIVVNSAGVFVWKALANLEEAEWDRILDTNLKASYLLVRAALPALVASGHGRILNVSSIHGTVGDANVVAHCAAKFGLVGLTKALAAELRGVGVTVNALCPGSTDNKSRELSSRPHVAPLKEKLDAHDVAAAALFLVSPAAATISGAVLDVWGGTTVSITG